ncbi:MAG: shikimate kinase [Hyphomonadaceae bacterium]|nr:shikimate kinase [Hyphomonadaceae bacterium]
MSAGYGVMRTHPVALVGLMGVGKTTIGRRLARHLDLPFYDSDDEIETASGRTIAGYFRDHGEEAFRAGERRVIDRILDGTPMVLATGGGAFIPEETRLLLKARATTVWLKGTFETIMERVSRNNTRPLLQVADPRAEMRKLMDRRYPIYAMADITVPIVRGPHNRTVNKVIRALEEHTGKPALQPGGNHVLPDASPNE